MSDDQMRSIDDVCIRITSGGTPSRRVPDYFTGSIPWLKTQEIRDGWVYETEEHISQEGLDNSSAKLLPPNTVMMAMYGATVGRLALLAREMTCNQAACAMIVDPNAANYRYLYYALLNDRDRIVDLANGAAQQNLSARTIRNLQYRFPPIEEQRAIAATLGALDDKIESNRRAMGVLQQLGDAIFAASSKESRLLSDVADITMGSSPKGADLNEDGDGLPFYQGTRDFGFRFPSLRVWTTAPVRTAAKNDTLMSVRAPVGELNRAHADCCIGRGVAAIHSGILPSTLYYAMRSSKSAWNKFQGEGTVFASVNKTDVHDVEVRWVGDDVTLELEERLHAIDARIESLEEESRRLAVLRDTLLPELLSGRVRATIEGGAA